MITLLHGDYIEASRIEFNRLRDGAKGKEIRLLDGRTIDDTLLTQSLESSSLFGGETIVFIERLFGKIGKQPKKIEALCTLLTAGTSIDIILWEDKELGPSIVKQLGVGTRNQLFKLPVIIFQFLDGIKPANAPALLRMFEGLVQNTPSEVIFSMVVKRFRQLIQLSEGIIPTGLAQWQANRLTTQAKSFTIEKLLTMYKELHDIEVHIKTGISPFMLSSLIEQFIVRL